jgi:hypothetical protein
LSQGENVKFLALNLDDKNLQPSNTIAFYKKKMNNTIFAATIFLMTGDKKTSFREPAPRDILDIFGHR